MCGIVCSVTNRAEQQSPAESYPVTLHGNGIGIEERLKNIHESLSAIEHRGPDGNNVWVDPSETVILGHCRLGLNDVNGGIQPISNEDHTISIIVNGEFYGFKEIRDDLIAKGHTFKTNSDSEIALHLYEEHGDSFLQHLRGEFAIVICDTNKSRVLVARDRMGVKPVYYTTSSTGNFYCASEIKALVGLGTLSAPHLKV